MGKDGRYEKRTQRKIRLILACIAVLMVFGLIGFAAASVNDMLSEINHVEVSDAAYKDATVAATEQQDAVEVVEVVLETEAEIEIETEPVFDRDDFINYLIVSTPAWEDGKQVTGTMVLCTLNTRTKTMVMTPLLENAYVAVPEYKSFAGGEMTLNAVYSKGIACNGRSGAMELFNQTLYHNFGIEVDHLFEIDLTLFAKVVGMLGSVEINLSDAEVQYLNNNAGVNIQPGEQVMDGKLAKAYVRMWDAEEETGVTGISGQRKIIEAILKQIKAENFVSLKSIVKQVLPMLTTSMSETELKECLLRLLPMVRDLSIEKGGSCPAVFEKQIITTEQNKEQEVLTFDVAQTTKAMRALTLGEK